MDFSLFYFADDANIGQDRYRLLLEGARFADEHEFTAVWTPERHFDSFGGAYPNPAVAGAAVAAVTTKVGIRAGSVVAPLHPAVRIAEDWSVVDNISGGRAGVAFASGWHTADFAIRPEAYPDRRRLMAETIETVRRLWRLDTVELVDGANNPVQVRIFPPPVQPDLPMWLSTAGNIDSFRTAGRLGVGVLTTMIGHSLAQLSTKIAAYRRSFAAGHGHDGGHVVVMAHTFLGSGRAEVREIVRAPFTEYLRKSASLVLRGAGEVLPGVHADELEPADLEFLVTRAFDRFFDTSGLFGTVADGVGTLAGLSAAGVDEVACLIDFVGDTDIVLSSLDYLDQLRMAWRLRSTAESTAVGGR
ncbi:MupA/Atu3671 family FMN-dependent luciferase-like monooxygenase [Amycolatopsis nigrescens]|uniref:MupA/Atu3671 family FMN-dependent luciferase-like monooxygenase n=1 Tax=Amycolatopsis nigrescens TaxID=381445 RepID=UPI00038023C0|nr:MupA/Atu3671 family FMN-dependent luciferase-like monooxygenase [Amycolatopsis nigrescens]